MIFQRPCTLWLLLAVFPCGFPEAAPGQDSIAVQSLTIASNRATLQFPMYPATESYAILSATNLNQSFSVNTNFRLSRVSAIANGATNIWYEWQLTNRTGQQGYYRPVATPMSSNAALSATVLNRLTYGPSPDELKRIQQIGPDAYIAEQLAPWNITEDVHLTHTNIPAIEAKFLSAAQFAWMTNATISDLRAWHVLRAVGARRQLLEILLQFLENHFVTQWSKAYDWFDIYYDNGTMRNILAAQQEFLENTRWRAALLNPSCTFYDLLKISAESPAMIIYLDSVISRGDGSNIANENYARELLELFTMGVDNGYDQADITVQSRIWTGWRVEKVALTNANNPFALPTATIFPGSTNTSTTTKSNLYGAWAFNYKTNFHNSTTKTIFPGKYVPARFGPPWTTKKYGTNSVAGLYQIVIPGYSRTDTNGISEGYKFIQYLADLPFTQEFISIKLCRLLVHENFPSPSSDPDAPEYAYYNYAGGNLTPEAALIRQCMFAWETNAPKGQIWKVLQTIVQSDLFRGQAAAQHKVKTPLEFVAAAVRSLRSSTNGSNLAGSFTAATDGYSIVGSDAFAASPLTRMGEMFLFDREAPDGYPEKGSSWISAGTLAERLRWVQSFCIAPGQAGHSGSSNDAGASFSDITGLLRSQIHATNWLNPEAVANHFLGLLFPGEGAGNLQLYREAAVAFLNDGAADPTPSTTPFRNLAVSSSATSAYDVRVRGMVGMLMTMQRFQEQ